MKALQSLPAGPVRVWVVEVCATGGGDGPLSPERRVTTPSRSESRRGTLVLGSGQVWAESHYHVSRDVRRKRPQDRSALDSLEPGVSERGKQVSLRCVGVTKSHPGRRDVPGTDGRRRVPRQG